MRHLSTVLKAVGLVAVLGIVGNSVSLAATGHGLVLGKSNKAAKATAIQRTTPGPVVALRTKRATDAPFTVNGRGRVANLNADTVDGLDSSAFARAATTAAVSERVDAVMTKAGSAEQTATDAAANAAAAQSTADSLARRLPIAQGYFLTDGSRAAGSYGIASSKWNVTDARFEITLPGVTTFFPSQYVTQVTPEGPCTADYRGSGAKLIVETRVISSSVTTTPAAINQMVPCPFSLTVTHL